MFRDFFNTLLGITKDHGDMAKRSNKRRPGSHEVECEYRGKRYRGTYQVRGGILTVASEYGSKSATPGACPEVLARILLREIVEAADGPGELSHG
jgi:hypothetical protein